MLTLRVTSVRLHTGIIYLIKEHKAFVVYLGRVKARAESLQRSQRVSVYLKETSE